VSLCPPLLKPGVRDRPDVSVGERKHVPPANIEGELLESMGARLGGELGLAPRTLADRLKDASYAELETTPSYRTT
jgi:hypothetical protein